MTPRVWITGCAVAVTALAPTIWAQPVSSWRSYKMADGLPEAACSSITVNSRGTILARHLISPHVTKLDGYSVSVLPAPPTRTGRVYETRVGQLWAAAGNGLFEFREEHWAFHPVPELAASGGEAASVQPYGIPLCPVRQGRVLVLLRDRLMELNSSDADHVKIEVLRSAAQTRIGDFLGLAATRHGGLWISGTRGLAKLPAPVRNLRSDTIWQEFEVPATSQFQNLREPREDDSGAVTAMAESAGVRNPVIVRFDGQRWTTEATGAERVRFAWNGPDQSHWIVTASTLFSRRTGSGWLPNEECSTPKFFDMAIEPSGTFWLATVDGLFRYSPATWRTPPAMQTLSGAVHGFVEDREGKLWFVSGGELHSLSGREMQSYPVADAAQRWLQTARRLIVLPEGALLFEANNQLYQFRPGAGEPAPVPLPAAGEQLRILGTLKDGLACVLRFKAGAPERDSRVETYDGSQFKDLSAAAGCPLPVQTLTAVYQAANGDFWFSTDQGVAHQRAGQWESFLAAERAVPEGAVHFAETTDGRIWCVTDDKLWLFESGNWTLLRAGFDHINGLVRARDDSVWVASNSGLHRLTSAGWIENGVEEGLPSGVVRSVFEDRHGQLWVGTSLGLSVHHPEADPDPPKTEVLTPSDQRIPEGGSLTIAFSGQDKWKFTSPKRLLYSWRLDDRDWTPFQEATTVTFTDLVAGNHAFQVRAMDRNANVERKPAQLAFIVPLPWFKETRLVMVAAFGAAVAMFFASLAFNRHRQLLRSYAEVEQKVAERTRELEVASRELLQSQKMTALGTLAAGIAHDFNNILSIIKGSAQIIEDNLDKPDKIRTRLDRIKIVVEQGAGTVQAMLGFSRSSDGSWVPCSLNAIVENTITLLGDRFLREVEVKVEGDPDLPEVPIAKDLVQQILLNFIFNAAESMSEVKRVILRTARLRTLPAHLVLKPAEAAEYVAVSVQDFGCGIPAEILPRVFEPFFTTKALSARRGTGLGLSMVYELARQMNAGLAMESTVGRGSTFTLILPVTSGPTPPDSGNAA